MVIRSGFAEKDGNGVFKLFALLIQQGELGAGGVKKSFFLRNIEAGRDAAVVTGVDEVEAFGQGIDSTREQRDLRVELAEGKIISRQFGSDEETNVFKVGSVRLIAGFGGFNAAAAPAKEVNFVADGEGQRVTILRDGADDREIAVWRTVARKTLAFSGRSSA